MIDILKIEEQNPDLTQHALASKLTFGFNRVLMEQACRYWGSSDTEREMFLSLINSKSMLINDYEPISNFFGRIADDKSRVFEVLESIKPLVKSGVHLSYSETVLTKGDKYVSLNELEYVIRLSTWFIKCINPEFNQAVNDRRDEKFILINEKFDITWLNGKRDIAEMTESKIKMKQGFVLKIYKV
jgi:hypothetical protein